ncbi:FIG01048949: hypothetical protein [Caballeronia glathei]|uniref:DUF2184 domain-containing protein n=1 Tax=Caballeronia glathei TaxID=60547 RepID=A0A069PM94_9BURK|nr:hypothetical protein [Caballeronia glathei]KDR41547.1 hypothetical protein BG61_16770 [Caballeronia glathei]CDY79472.1 FIG01048949: hypothetical protein [Caballeronia glathei]
MANIVPAQIRVSPSYVVPELLLQYQQASGAFETIATGDPLVRLGEDDLAVYIKRLDLRTEVQVGQFAANQLPSCTIVYNEISTPTYMIRSRAEYDHHDTAALGRVGASTVEAHRLAMRQGTFQQQRNLLLYGANPLNGEGLLNTNGATALNLPADMNGNTTVSTYDNGAFAFFMLQQIGAIKVRTMQMGMPARFSVVMPQRILESISYQGIVQLTQFQREGAGSKSVRGLVDDVLEWNEDEITWGADDTLVGKGAGGTDMIVISMPEVKKPKANKINTNVFAELTPGLEACSLQLVDRAAPTEIIAPLPAGAVDVVSELRSTSGWAARPEALTLISAGF